MAEESTHGAMAEAASRLGVSDAAVLSPSHWPFLQQALSTLGIGVVAADAQGSVTFLNQVAERLTGWSLAEVFERPLDVVFRLLDMRDARSSTSPGPGELEESCQRREEALLVTAAGNSCPIEYSVSPIRDRSGRGLGLVIAFRSISEQRLLELHLERVSHHDLLTGLLNRQGFLEHLARALTACREGKDYRVLLFLDIDQFKLINDTCDHAAGDELLQWVAGLLREVVGERDLAARLGGDEFALLVACPTLEKGIRFTEKVQRRLQEYLFSWEDKSFTITASVGVAPVGGESANAAYLLSAADHACYMAKEKGRNGIQVYEHGDAEVTRQRDEMNWMARINHKLESGQVHLYAQPIRPLSPMALRGLQFEVLIRLVESDGRIRTPAQLVHAAERFGLMPVVDRWVVRSVLRALRELEDDGLVGVHLCCINLSGLSLRDASVLDSIRSHLSETSIPPHKLCFEITETAAVQDLQQAKWLIQELGSIGCNLALDDFGTGVASYSYLKELPVNYLKVAGSFVEGLLSSDLDRAMVESINQISHMLGIETIAEHVGTRDLYDRVRAIGIDHAQGYWIGVPKPFAETCRPWR